jgi:hypothetical protein
VSRLSRKCGSPDVSQSDVPSRPVTGIALPYFFTMKTYRGVEVYHYNSGLRDEWFRKGGRVGPRVCLDALFPFTGNPILTVQPLPVSIPTELSRLPDLHVSFIYSICSLFNNAVRNSEFITSNDWMTVNWEGCRRKRPWLILVLSQHLLGGTQEHHRTYSKISRHSGRDSNRASPKYRSEALSLDHSFTWGKCDI